MGIHGQRGVSCADCHMPYMSKGGVKYTDHHIMSPLANIDRTCQTCHRQSAETLRQNVYERQHYERSPVLMQAGWVTWTVLIICLVVTLSTWVGTHNLTNWLRWSAHDIAAGQVRGVEGGCGQVRQLGQVAADEAAVWVEVQRFGKRVVQTACLLPIVVIDGIFVIGQPCGKTGFPVRRRDVQTACEEIGTQAAQGGMQAAATIEGAHGGIDYRYASPPLLPAHQGFAAPVRLPNHFRRLQPMQCRPASFRGQFQQAV